MASPQPAELAATAPNFETHLYLASLKREKEFTAARSRIQPKEDGHWGSLFSKLFRRSAPSDELAVAPATDEKSVLGDDEVNASSYISNRERRAASSALRTATWGSVFYLITTDILGPYSAPYAFAQVGYGPGVACFFVFGGLAAYGGWLLWYMFLKLDSEEYPLRTFGDLAKRIYGKYASWVCDFLQSVQLIFNVAIIMIGNGQGLSQMANFKFCFTACIVVWMLAGMILGQIRTLQKFGWVANLAIWMNILVLIMTMGAVAAPGAKPNTKAATPSYDPLGPVTTLGIVHQPFENQVTGIMQIVFSYGGAMIFIEFMSEMRHPWDFWKAMTVAQSFIFVVYMFFGIFVYAYQGQYVVNPANQGIAAYGLQTATNAISLTASLIAAALYGNIGVKVIYNTIAIPLLRAPSLTSRRGKIAFAFAAISYWSIAFVIGSAIPQFTSLSGLLAAVCIFQFTYTFPPLLMLGFCLQSDALKGDNEYDPTNPTSSRVDSWRDLSRWQRALFPSFTRFLFNFWNLIYTLACLSCAALGAYSAIVSIKAGFANGSGGSTFGCHSPVQGS